ncbi:MAG: diaminopimelate epimerase [Candidatus Omnitrophota bacterium]|nr:diaminopimelate epimerase [Candidatus Omnitrophota bacterium]
MRPIDFIKMSAAGNDFIIIDKFRSRPLTSPGAEKPEDTPRLCPSTGSGLRSGQGSQISELAKELCQRKLSIGADGLLLIEPSEKADFKMRIFNPDGKEVEMCGNGARCVALYAVKKGSCSDKMIIETQAGSLEAEVEKDKIKIKLVCSKNLRLKFDLNINSQVYKLSYINTGVPHVVCFVRDLDNFDVEGVGRAIRYHGEFQPEGTNANFVEIVDKSYIKIRTYERGVEQETLACGTGSAAAVLVSASLKKVNPPVSVQTRGGEVLKVYFDDAELENVWLEGGARVIYKGEVGNKMHGR